MTESSGNLSSTGCFDFGFKRVGDKQVVKPREKVHHCAVICALYAGQGGPRGFCLWSRSLLSPLHTLELSKSYPMSHSNKYLAINGRGRTKVWKPESSGKP